MTDLPTPAPSPNPGSSAPNWEDWFRLLLESARDYAIFSVDLERRVNYWSTGASRLFQYEEKEAIGGSADVLFTPEDRAADIPALEMARAAQVGRASDERWHIRKDGSRFFASGLVFPLLSPDKELIGFVKIARDLTERQLVAERLKSAHAELEQRVKERTAALDAANQELKSTNQELRFEIEQRQRAEALRIEAVRRIANIQEDERRSLSRDIHDQLGQQLAALSLGLTGLERAGPELPARVAELQVLADQISREMHAVAFQLRPTSLEDLGLQRALASAVELWSTQTKIRTEFHVSGMTSRRLPKDIELALYRITQEALANTRRHSEATSVSVVLSCTDTEVVTVIEDDGKGFEAEQKAESGTRRLGLIGMNERAAQFGGRVTVESSVGKGTAVFVRIPLLPP